MTRLQQKLGLLLLAAALTLTTACAQSGSDSGGAGHGAHGESGDHAKSGKPAGQDEQGGHGAHGAGASSASAGSGDTTEATWKFSGEPVKPGAETQLTVSIRSADGTPVETFERSHEKLMHLIVVSKDLSYFNHIHPEYRSKGQFEIAMAFPQPGRYKLFADYVPAGGGGGTVTRSVFVDTAGTAPSPVPLVPDRELNRTVAGKQVSLSIDHPMAGMEAQLTFSIQDAQTGKPITDLQPYLGAVGHVVVLSADAENYLHVHPVDEKSTGPEAKFKTAFPAAGLYKLWGQFQQKGEVFTVPFVIQIP